MQVTSQNMQGFNMSKAIDKKNLLLVVTIALNLSKSCFHWEVLKIDYNFH